MAFQEKQPRNHSIRPSQRRREGWCSIPAGVTRMLVVKRHGWDAKRIAREVGIARGTCAATCGSAGTARTCGARRRAESRLAQRALSGGTAQYARALARGARARHPGRLLDARAGDQTVARGAGGAARATDALRDPAGPADAFGELRVPIAGMMTLVRFCVLTLGYSRRTFVRAILARATGAFGSRRWRQRSSISAVCLARWWSTAQSADDLPFAQRRRAFQRGVFGFLAAARGWRRAPAGSYGTPWLPCFAAGLCAASRPNRHAQRGRLTLASPKPLLQLGDPLRLGRRPRCCRGSTNSPMDD
jgi:hypothetical protein